MKKVIFKSLFTSILLVLGLSVGVKQTTHEVVEAATTTDVLTADMFNATDTHYKDFSGVVGSSGAVYAGQTANYKGAIQLRSSGSNSGIVTTSSAGTVVSVSVSFNSETTSARKLDVYVSNTAFTSASQLYNNGLGEKVYSFENTTYTNGTEVVIEGNYQYIGFRSNSKALYLDNITINWQAFADYTATLHYNDGTTPDGSITSVEGKFTAPETPTRTGYTFLGWYLDDGTFKNLFDFELEVEENIDLYAGWVSDTATQYTVKFDGNGATNTMNDVILVPEADEAVSYTLPENEFIFEGKVFTGWSVNEESKNPGDEILVNADTTITATWRDYITTSELTFDKNLMRLEVGESTTLSLTNNGDDTPTWNSSNPTVATITGNEVKALSKGTTTITAEVNGVKAECLVIVEIAQGTTVYKKITGEQVDYSGRYLVAYVDKYNSAIAMKNSGSSYIEKSNNLTISNDLIMDYQDAAVFEIIKNSDGTYSLTADGTNYVSYSGSGNSAGFSSYDESDEGIKFNITSENDVFKFESVKISGRYLQYNTSSPRFACYTQSRNQKDLTLFKETVYKASLTSQYDQMLMNNYTEGVRLLGSLNKDDFYNVSEVGFVVTLKEEGKEAVSKVHVAESIYDTLIDDDEGYVFVEGDGTFTKEGYASFGLILTDIPETLNGTIEFFAYAKDGSGQYLYLSETITLTYVNGALQIA